MHGDVHAARFATPLAWDVISWGIQDPIRLKGSIWTKKCTNSLVQQLAPANEPLYRDRYDNCKMIHRKGGPTMGSNQAM